MENLNKVFSNRFNTALAERFLNQKQAASLCHISPQSIWRYLHGSLPNAETLLLISENLNISIDWLFGLSD